MTLKPERILIVAGEASGDLHGGNLVRALKAIHPALEFEGVGGAQMRAAGVQTLYDIERLGGMGLFEFLGNLWHHVRIFRHLSREIACGRYRAAILINYPAFNLRLAKRCKSAGCPVLYYISPQIWASRKGRIRTIRETGKKMYVILPFEEALYRDADVDVEYLGHPFVDIVKPSRTREELIEELKLDSAAPIIGLFPGSRMSEINYLLDDIVGAAARVRREIPSCQFLLPVADSLDPDMIRQKLGANALGIHVLTGRNYDVMSAADCLVMASGSATLEAGMLGCPMVIVYRVHPVTYHIGKHFAHITHFGLVNIVAGEGVVPELLNEQVTPENIASEVLKVLQDEAHQQALRARLSKVRETLGAPGVVQRIAQSMIRTLNLPTPAENEKASF